MANSKGIHSPDKHLLAAKEFKSLLLAAIIFLMTIAAYSNSFHNSFHFDDSHTIVNNLYIRNIANIPLFFKDGTTFSSLPSNQSYRPVVTATLAIDYWLGNGLGDTFYFHLSMVILFLVQGILMVFFYLKVFDIADRKDKNIFIAILAAGLYLVHPANAETINYIISRSDSFSAMFMVLSFVMYCSSEFCKKRHLYLIPLALGILTKPIAFIFPVLLLFYIFLFEKKASLLELLSIKGFSLFLDSFKKTAPSFIFTMLMLIFIKIMDPPTWTPGGASHFQYLITQPYVILKYFISFFLPISLSADTDLMPFKSVNDFRFFFGSLFLAALLVTAVLTSLKERLRPISFGILWFFFTLLPTSIMPLAEVMNDHRVFLPYIGLMLSVSWSGYLLFAFFQSRASFRYLNAATVLFVALLFAAGAYGTYQRNKVWKTEETLWKDVTEKSPGNGRGHMNYGLALMTKGDYQGAEKHFLRALELSPNYATLHINLGVLNAATGKQLKAEQHFQKAIFLKPDYPAGYFYYARFLDKQNRFEEAIANLEKTINLSSGHMEARHLLMTVYQAYGDSQKATELARRTLAIFPQDGPSLELLKTETREGQEVEKNFSAASPEYHLNMSLARFREGEFDRSIESAKEALNLRPDYDLAYNNICAAYIELKLWDMAIDACQQAMSLNPDNQLAKNNLAWANREKKAAEKKPN